LSIFSTGHVAVLALEAQDLGHIALAVVEDDVHVITALIGVLVSWWLVRI
jgi:hypothetical protein